MLGRCLLFPGHNRLKAIGVLTSIAFDYKLNVALYFQDMG